VPPPSSGPGSRTGPGPPCLPRRARSARAAKACGMVIAHRPAGAAIQGAHAHAHDRQDRVEQRGDVARGDVGSMAGDHHVHLRAVGRVEGTRVDGSRQVRGVPPGIGHAVRGDDRDSRDRVSTWS
jgi:hypothetical protein